jgi:hypothetical protein
MEQSAGINLLPDQGHGPSKVTESQRVSFALSLGILGLTALIAVLVEGSHLFLDGLNGSYLSRIDTDNQQLSGLHSTEVLYLGIDSKLVRLQSLLASYPKNSIFLDDVSSLTPSGVRLDTLGLDPLGKVTITGTSKGADAFGQFVNILKDPTQGGKKFSNVDITALTGNGKDNSYSFTLTMLHKATTSNSSSAGVSQ